MDTDRDQNMIEEDIHVRVEEIVKYYVDNKFKKDGRNVEGYKSILRPNIYNILKNKQFKQHEDHKRD